MLSIIFYLRLPVSEFVLCDLADRLAGPGEVVNTGLEVNTMARKSWWARSTLNMKIIFLLLKGIESLPQTQIFKSQFL